MSNYKKCIESEINSICSISPELIRDTFTSPAMDFTRNRKQSLGDVLKVGLLNAGTCINEQLRFCHGIGDDRASASAYIQQRDKLTQDSYRRIFEIQCRHISNFTLFRKQYLVIAIDGSDVNIHPNPDDESTICRTYNKRYEEREKVMPVNQLHLNAAVCVPDGFFIDYEIQDWAYKDERKACAEMMNRIAASDRYKGYMVIITCDRGYESFYLMMLADSLGLKYCFRVHDAGSGVGIASRYMGLCDDKGCIDAVIDKKYTYCCFVEKEKDKYPDYVLCHRENYNPFIPPSPNSQHGSRRAGLISFHPFSFRLIRFPLGNGDFETLVTNLSNDELGFTEFKALYHMRWGIETSFRQLKHDDCASFMHSRKKNVAIGEMILSMVFHNICTMVLMLLAEKAHQYSAHHALLYRISYSDLASTLRLFISGRSPTITIDKIVGELLITLQPVRNGRSFIRVIVNHPFVPFIYRAA